MLSASAPDQGRSQTPLSTTSIVIACGLCISLSLSGAASAAPQDRVRPASISEQYHRIVSAAQRFDGRNRGRDGLQLFKQQQRQRLLDILQAYEAAPETPERYEDLQTLIAICQELGDHQRCRHFCRRAMQINPDRVEPHCALIGSLLQQEEIDHASILMERAMHKFKQEPKLRSLHAAFYAACKRAKRCDQAAVHLIGYLEHQIDILHLNPAVSSRIQYFLPKLWQWCEGSRTATTGPHPIAVLHRRLQDRMTAFSEEEITQPVGRIHSVNSAFLLADLHFAYVLGKEDISTRHCRALDAAVAWLIRAPTSTTARRFFAQLVRHVIAHSYRWETDDQRIASWIIQARQRIRISDAEPTHRILDSVEPLLSQLEQAHLHFARQQQTGVFRRGVTAHQTDVNVVFICRPNINLIATLRPVVSRLRMSDQLEGLKVKLVLDAPPDSDQQNSTVRMIRQHAAKSEIVCECTTEDHPLISKLEPAVYPLIVVTTAEQRIAAVIFGCSEYSQIFLQQTLDRLNGPDVSPIQQPIAPTDNQPPSTDERCGQAEADNRNTARLGRVRISDRHRMD